MHLHYGCLLAGLAIAASACAHVQPGPEPQYITPNGPSRAPYSPAVRVGDLIFVSGQIGSDSTGHLAAGGIQEETRWALRNVDKVLHQSGSSLDRAVQCTVFLADIKEWGAMNQVYATFFPNHKPARSAVGVGGISGNGRVEIECIAAAG